MTCIPRLQSRAMLLGLGLTIAASAAVAEAPCGQATGYPSFCSIPQIPGDVPSAATYKSVVVDTRLSGRSLEQNTDPSHFSLTDTEGFVALAKAEAAPPPPPDQSDTATFLRDARARATPPARPR